MGLILLILLLIKKLETIAIENARANIGRKATGLKEKWEPVDKALPISILARNENINSSTLATAKEIKHWIKEW